MIDHSRKLIFVHIARTAGTSVEKALIDQDWWDVEPATKHLSCQQARKSVGKEIWNEYVSFSVVRNPWDRMASMWKTGWWWQPKTRFRGQKPATFEEFIRRVKPHPHEHYPSLRYDKILNLPLDHILKFETLSRDFAHMLESENMAPASLPHLMPSVGARYQELYDKRTRDLVARIYKRDIERFEYTFD